MPIIKSKADTGAVIYSDGFKTYDGLVNYGYKKHYRVKHSENEFANGHNHINGIENFWGLCKVRLAKFRGVHKHTFYLHIKECEFRYNYRNKNSYLTLLKELRKNKLNLNLLLLPQLISYVALINVCALPYSLWSVWHQKSVAKQWCPLCLIVQGLFWGIFVVNLMFGFIQIPAFTIGDVILAGCVYAGSFFTINLSVSTLITNNNIMQITQEMNSLKMSEEVFAMILKKQKHYKVSKDASQLIWGNPDADILITILTNPHCNPCAQMHKRANNLLENIGNKVCVQYILSSFDKRLDSSNKFLIAVYQNKGRDESAEIFDEWFTDSRFGKNYYFEKYAMDMDSKSVNDEFTKHKRWKEEAGLNLTPTILINGYKLPENYKIEDIKYFSEYDFLTQFS